MTATTVKACCQRLGGLPEPATALCKSLRCFATGKQPEMPAGSIEDSDIPGGRLVYDPEPPEGAMGRAPFIPPAIDKMIRMIMRDGKRTIAQRIVFDTSHALYNAIRPVNPRPELQARKEEFVP